MNFQLYKLSTFNYHHYLCTMGSKDKLKRFAEMETFPNVFQPTMDEIKTGSHHMKGKWHQSYFKNNNPIVLELGCGKGEYTVGMAERYPNKNFIGIDIKGARIWRGAKTAFENNMPNVAFLRTRIDFIEHFFAENEVSEIWLTFSDPQPKKPNKRLLVACLLSITKSFYNPMALCTSKQIAICCTNLP
jgi:tRNA (guanine-N7-)-methyltransferase